jgi:hypothetical protein
MSVTGISVVVPSANQDAAVERYKALLEADVVEQFLLPGGSFSVTVLPGISILSGDGRALAPLKDLRATLVVDSLARTHQRLEQTGWVVEGTLGSSASLLARDPDGVPL